MRKRPHSGRFLFRAPELRFCTHKQIFRPQCTSFSSPMLLYKEKRGEKSAIAKRGRQSFCKVQLAEHSLCPLQKMRKTA